MVRSIFLAVLFLFSSDVFASDGAKSIYLALNVEDRAGECIDNSDQDGPEDIYRHCSKSKSVGGITCEHLFPVQNDGSYRGYPSQFQEIYNCIVKSNTTIEAKSLWDALNIKAVDTCTAWVCPNSTATYVKTVGSLSCFQTSFEMSEEIQPTEYSCEISL